MGQVGAKAPRDVLLRPLYDLVDYVYKAWSAGLDKNEECMYGGSRLLMSALDTTGRFTSDLGEANELFMSGMRFAKRLWDMLDGLKGDVSAFRGRVEQIADSLIKERGRGAGHRGR